MELGNWPIKGQLGSTNNKGLPVLFQDSHQGLFLNNPYLLSNAVNEMPQRPPQQRLHQQQDASSNASSKLSCVSIHHHSSRSTRPMPSRSATILPFSFCRR